MKGTMGLIDAVQKSGLPAEAKYDIAHELGIKRAQFNNRWRRRSATVSATVAPLEDAGGGGRGGFGFGDAETMRMAIPGRLRRARECGEPGAVGGELRAAERAD